MLHCRLIYMLSILCVRLTIKVKVGIPEIFKVGWYPPPPAKKKLGRVTLRPVNKKEQRNYNDFSRHAENIQAVPRENENKWEFGWSTKEFSSFKCYFLSFVIRFGLLVLFLHQKQRIIYLNLRALSKSKSWSVRPPVLTNGKRPLSMARPRPLLSKVKSVESGIHPWGMAHWPLN